MEWITFLLLAGAYAVLWVKRIRDAVLLLGFQALLLAVLTWQYAWEHHSLHLFAVAALIVIVKAVAIPGVLLYTLRKIDVKREVERFFSKSSTMLVGLLLILLAHYLASRLELYSASSAAKGVDPLAVALSFLLLGAYIMIGQKKAIMQGIGLIVIENGLYLTAMVLLGGLHLIVDLGIFFDILVSVIVIGILSYRINSTFESLNTEHLEKLKG